MAGLTRFDPFNDLTNMHSQIDELFSNLLGSHPISNFSAPAMDVYSDDNKSLVAELHVPGFNKDDIEINIHDNTLEIKGEKHQKEDRQEKKKSYIVRESHSSFYRSIALPKRADGDNIKAHFEDGILKVTVPLKKLPEPKKVAITSTK
jgi:HSP20 family protein